jgi:hypothetical protein
MYGSTIYYQHLPTGIYAEEARTPEGIIIPRTVTTLMRIGYQSVENKDDLDGIYFDIEKFRDPERYESPFQGATFIDHGPLEWTRMHEPNHERANRSTVGGQIRIAGKDGVLYPDTDPESTFGVTLELNSPAFTPLRFRYAPIDYARYVATSLLPLLGEPTFIVKFEEYRRPKQIKFTPYR